jgi:RNA polymerase sigma-70 factor (ECF subfamily)
MFSGRSPRDERPGDGDEFSAAALECLNALYGASLRLTRNADQAQDLVQDTYLKAFRARKGFTPGTNLKAWLFTILHNTWRNRRRDAARARVEFDSEVVEQAAEVGTDRGGPRVESPEGLLLRQTLSADLQAALDALPEAFREVVWLRDVDELTYQEVADVLGIPIGTVMSRLSRGRRQLYDSIQGTRQKAEGRNAEGRNAEGRNNDV